MRGANRSGRLAVLAEISYSEFDSYGELFQDQAIDLAAKARTVAQHIIDLRPRVKDGRAPSGARFHSGRGIELEEMPEDAPDLRLQLSPIRRSQTLDLLRQVFPIERQIRVFRAAQCRRLLYGPEKEILVIKFTDLGHVLSLRPSAR